MQVNWQHPQWVVPFGKDGDSILKKQEPGQKWKLWDGSLKGHLRFYRPSATNYVVRGVGTFAIIAIMFPRSRFLGAILMGLGYVVAEFLSYQIALALYRRRLKKKYHR